MFYIRFYREHNESIFFHETTMPIALIFGMKHRLVDFYQVCSNYPPEAKNGPTPGVTCFTWAYKGRAMKKSSCLKPQGLEP